MKELVISYLQKVTKLSKKELSDLIESPPNPALGDYAFPTFSLAKKLKKNPVEIAKDLASKKFPGTNFDKIEVKGPYVNFFINKKLLAEQTLKAIQKQKDKYGSSNSGKGKKLLIEHTSINPNASPHVGRARNALIGDAITRLFKFEGFKVETHYFVNDVGKQIALLVLGAEKRKNAKFKDLLDIYVKINKEMETNPKIEKKAFELLNKLENGDKKIKAQFKKVVDTCIKGQSKILDKLDIKFDHYDYESEYLWNNKTKQTLALLKKTKKVFQDEEGRTILNQEGYNLPLRSPVLVLTRADNTSLYPLRDITYTIEKMKKNKNNIIVLGEDQKTYFKQIEAALDLLKSSAPRAVHYSFVLLKEGKMSTRKGQVVLLEDFMNEAVAKAKSGLSKRKGNMENAEAIAYAAIKYSILKIDPLRNVIFNLSTALAFEGDTGPYLLYSYARARSILRKAKNKGKFTIKDLNPSEKKLILQLNSFPEVVEKAHRFLSPSIIANYAFQLSQNFNEFYHTTKVIGSKEESERLAIVDAFSQVLKNSLSLLGIQAIERM